MPPPRRGAHGRPGAPGRRSAGQVPPAGGELAPGPRRGHAPVDQHDDPVGLRPARRALLVAPTTVAPPLAQGRPQLDLGRRVERGGDVVGEQQVGVCTPVPGPARAAAPGRRRGARRGARRALGAPGLLDVAAQTGGRDAGPTSRSSWSRGRCRRTSPRAPAGPGRHARPGEGRSWACGSPTAAVPADRRRCWSPARRVRRAGWTCRSRPGQQQHQLSGLARSGRRR